MKFLDFSLIFSEKVGFPWNTKHKAHWGTTENYSETLTWTLTVASKIPTETSRIVDKNVLLRPDIIDTKYYFASKISTEQMWTRRQNLRFQLRSQRYFWWMGERWGDCQDTNLITLWSIKLKHQRYTQVYNICYLTIWSFRTTASHKCRWQITVPQMLAGWRTERHTARRRK